MLEVLKYMALGMLGALMAEGAELLLYTRTEGRVPWERGASDRGRLWHGKRYPALRVYLFGTGLKAALGVALVGILAGSDQISGIYAAASIGAAAPLFVSQLAGAKDLGMLSKQTVDGE